ncbi:IS256 family transposase [Anaerobacillus alkaliphilus]|uniref:Mutator family transposase n=1 Tax=Anaerobacillus alkaliphilus TaxID=1548597 RepID=A0A4Q0VMX0_9BACI|nr:IS256 family transposase [Anaerobacillus alkaliphilus]RXI96747.1 IS256 family transposase [Anaerobacillus alkaliphilus]
MKPIIPNNDFTNQLEDLVKNFLKDKMELYLKEEIKNFIEVEKPDQGLQRNGYYERSLDTKYGKIEDISVPRDRQGEYKTQLFEPYQRRDGWLEEAIIRMYQSGMSTRDVGRFVEKMVGSAYSATTISNITEVVHQDIEAWQKRPLNKRYSVLYLDGMYIKVRRDTVDKEVVYVVMGVNEDGHREILAFYVGGRESSTGWHTILADLYTRGLREVLLGVFDGLSGLEEAFLAVYPKADVQRCVVHKVRNTLNQVRKKDQVDISEGLKLIYKSPTREIAQIQFEKFKEEWSKKYPKEVQSWEQDLPVLLTFMKYPMDIRSGIYTTNWIERTIKEFRKRVKPMNSLPDIKAAEKILYLTVKSMNDKWSTRISAGFAQSKSKLQEMFTERYN